MSKRTNKRGSGKQPFPFLGGSFGSNLVNGRGGSFNGTTGDRTTRSSTPLPGLTPGQSVVPGSIDIPNESYSWTSGKTPESVWWSHGEMGSTLPWIQALLKNSNAGGTLSQGYADVLATIIKQLQNDQNTAINPDMVMSLFNNLLSYQTTQEQRGYDYMMLNESRQYNNPTNELARYMGAGISRDAALQLLSGSAGNLGSGGGSAAAVQGPAAGAGAAALNSSNAHQNLVNNVFNGIQMVANLVGQGMSVAQSIEQVQGMHMVNYLTQKQIGAYDSVDQVVQFLHNATMQGILEPSTLDGFSNAQDVFKWLIEHKDEEAVVPLFQSGAVANTFGSQFGREMFNNHWQQQNRSRTEGEILDKFITGMQLQNDIAALQPAVIGVEMENLTYQNLALEAQELSFYQNMQESAARIRLIDKQGNLIDWQAKDAELQYTLNEAGFPIMKQNKIDELNLAAHRWAALYGRDGVNRSIKTADGQELSPLEANILSWLQDGTNAYDAAYLQHMYNGAYGSFATRYPTLFRLAAIFDKFGVFRFLLSEQNQNVRTGTNAVANIIPDF